MTWRKWRAVASAAAMILTVTMGFVALNLSAADNTRLCNSRTGLTAMRYWLIHLH